MRGAAEAARARCAAVAALAALVASLCAAAAPASAAVRIAPGELFALTARGSTAFAVVDSGRPAAPLALLRSSGRSAGRARAFGGPESEFPDLAADARGVTAVWAVRASGGEIYRLAAVPEAGAPGTGSELGRGTGPPRLALLGSTRLVAFPDSEGDVALLVAPAGAHSGLLALTTNGPFERHLPLDVAADPSSGASVVLDLGQTRTQSQLRVLGADAPRAPIVVVGALRGIAGSLVLGDGRVRVAYMSAGRATLATAPASPGGAWSRLRLPGPGGGTGGPAVATAGDATIVAYMQRLRGRQTAYVATVRGGRATARALGPARTGDVFAAASGAVAFAGWTGPRGAMIARVR